LHFLVSGQRKSSIDDMASLKSYQSKRVSSYDRAGKNADRLVIKPGETAVIARIEGAGNYFIANIEGKGHFVGINYYVDSPSPIWYGEGDDMFFIDGEKWPPSLHGTGTEDFFNSSWCPKEIYMHPYFGYARVNNETGWLGRTHCYRFFLESPITFEKSLKASIEHGHNNCLTLDLVTVAYWYQREPHKSFPKMKPKEERQNMEAIGPVQIHKWRDAWRKSLGSQKLWGNEKKKNGD
jgi:hypothetical protein